MREIKFRAWDKSCNKMRGINGIQDCFSLRSDGICNEDYILMQYTGLKDKNGKEIFEGDIIENSLIIKWNQLHNCFGYFSNNGFVKEILSNVYDSKGNLTYCHIGFEIIGNIYENQEFLK
jgi:uncharacterized phage protein (TIGR01671 family)